MGIVMKFYNNTNNDKEKIFEKLQNEEINDKDLKKAEKKANLLGKLTNDFMLLISMLKDYWNGDFEISNTDLAIIIGAISYVILPLDAIPDFIPAIGYGDDIGIISIAISKLNNLINEYKRRK